MLRAILYDNINFFIAEFFKTSKLFTKISYQLRTSVYDLLIFSNTLDIPFRWQAFCLDSLPAPSPIPSTPSCIFCPHFCSAPPLCYPLSVFSHCIQQILEGVHHCHSNSIIHRDLKVGREVDCGCLCIS